MVVDGPNGIEIDPVETADEQVRTRRTLELHGVGVLVTHRIEAMGSSHSEFVLVDTLPAHLDVARIGFHPDHEPAHGHVDSRQAVLSGVVTPGQPLRVIYGICPVHPQPPEALETVQRAASMAIERARPVDPTAVDAADLEAAVMTRASSTAKSYRATQPRRFLTRLWQAVRGPDGGTSTPAGGPSASQSDTAIDQSDGTVQSPTASAESDQPATGPAGMTRDTARPAEPGGAPTETPAISVDTDTVRVAARAGTALAHRLYRRRDAETRASTRPPATTDVVTAFVREVESGAVPDAVRDGLADELRELLEQADGPQSRPAVRLGALESRLRNADDVASTLEAVIDRHGPSDEFVAGIRTDLGLVQRTVAGIRDDLDGLESTQTDMELALAAVAADLDRLDRRLEHAEGRLDALRAAHRSSAAALDGDAMELAGRIDRLEPLGDQVGDLEDAVTAIRRQHAALVDALTGDDTGT